MDPGTGESIITPEAIPVGTPAVFNRLYQFNEIGVPPDQYSILDRFSLEGDEPKKKSLVIYKDLLLPEGTHSIMIEGDHARALDPWWIILASTIPGDVVGSTIGNRIPRKPTGSG